MILIGVDPHKSSHTAVAVDAAGHQVAQRRFVVNAGTFRQLMHWCERWPERRFAVEGAGGLGRSLAQQLAAAGESVVDVPSTLSARARLLATGGDRKTDATDALHVAQVALFRQDLRPVAQEDQTTILRLLTERRDDLTAEMSRPGGRRAPLPATPTNGDERARRTTRSARRLWLGIGPLDPAQPAAAHTQGGTPQPPPHRPPKTAEQPRPAPPTVPSPPAHCTRTVGSHGHCPAARHATRRRQEPPRTGAGPRTTRSRAPRPTSSRPVPLQQENPTSRRALTMPASRYGLKQPRSAAQQPRLKRRG